MQKKTIKYLILEDSYFLRAEIIKDISTTFPYMQLEGVAEGISDAMDIISQKCIDLMIADTEVCDGNTVTMIEDNGLRIPVILYSEYSHIRRESVCLNLVDYILKPVKHEDLKMALSRFERMHFGKRDKGEFR